jgi:hypothetical protein
MATGGSRVSDALDQEYPQWQALQFEAQGREDIAAIYETRRAQQLDSWRRAIGEMRLEEAREGFIPIPLLELDPTHAAADGHAGSSYLPQRVDFSRTPDARKCASGQTHEWRVDSVTGYTEDPELLGFDPTLGPHTVVSERSDRLERETRKLSELVDNIRTNPDRLVIGIPSAPTLRAAQQMEGLNATLAKRPCAGCKSEGERIDARLDQQQREIDGIRRLLVNALAQIEGRGIPFPQ